MLGSSLILGTGLFVSVEFAFLALNRAQLRGLKGRDKKILLSLLPRTSTHLSVAQFGITVTTLLTGFTLEPVLSRFFGHFPASTLLAVFLATVLSMLFGEIVPKNLALSRPLTMARIVLYPYLFFYRLSHPFVNVLDASANFCARKLGLKLKQELTDFRDAGEMHALFRHSAQAGSISEDQRDYFSRALLLNTKSVADIMTPRLHVKYVSKDASLCQLRALALEYGFREYPVVGSGMDDVVGVVDSRKVLPLVSAPADVDAPVGETMPADGVVSDIATPAVFCSGSANVGSLLQIFEHTGSNFAVVVDEYGGTDGIVTRMDVMRRLGGGNGSALAAS